jgi:hypothetical protein
MSLTSLRIASALLLAAFVFIPAAVTTTPVAASDDDIICFDYSLPGGREDTECGTRGDYKVECKLVDPDNTSEFCQDVNSAALWRANMLASTGPTESHEIKLPGGSAKPTRR